MLHHVIARTTPFRFRRSFHREHFLLKTCMGDESCAISIVRSQFICALQEPIVRRRVEGRVERSLELATSLGLQRAARSGARRTEPNFFGSAASAGHQSGEPQ
jgi:hypothetical protein